MHPLRQLLHAPFFIGSVLNLHAQLVHGLIIFIPAVRIRKNRKLGCQRIKQRPHQAVQGLLPVRMSGQLLRHHQSAELRQPSEIGQRKRSIQRKGQPGKKLLILPMQFKMDPVVIVVRPAAAIMYIRMSAVQKPGIWGKLCIFPILFKKAFRFDQKKGIILIPPRIQAVQHSRMSGIIAASVYRNHESRLSQKRSAPGNLPVFGRPENVLLKTDFIECVSFPHFRKLKRVCQSDIFKKSP